MPRIYKPDPSRKSYEKHSKETIEKAIKEVQRGLSLRKAAEKFSIPHTVLYRHMKRGDQMKQQGGQMALSSQEEKLLVEQLQLCEEWNYPIDGFTLRLLVKDFLDCHRKTVSQFKKNMPGPDFVYSFIRRHRQKLSMRICPNIKGNNEDIIPKTKGCSVDLSEILNLSGKSDFPNTGPSSSVDSISQHSGPPSSIDIISQESGPPPLSVDLISQHPGNFSSGITLNTSTGCKRKAKRAHWKIKGWGTKVHIPSKQVK